MIIRDLYIKGIIAFPFEAQSPLFINTNAILAIPVSNKFF